MCDQFQHHQHSVLTTMSQLLIEFGATIDLAPFHALMFTQSPTPSPAVFSFRFVLLRVSIFKLLNFAVKSFQLGSNFVWIFSTKCASNLVADRLNSTISKMFHEFAHSNRDCNAGVLALSYCLFSCRCYFIRCDKIQSDICLCGIEFADSNHPAYQTCDDSFRLQRFPFEWNALHIWIKLNSYLHAKCAEIFTQSCDNVLIFFLAY